MAAIACYSAVSAVLYSLQTYEISEFVVQPACESLGGQHELGKGASLWAEVPTFVIQQITMYFFLGKRVISLIHVNNSRERLYNK